MALINCPDCNKEISSNAPSCPNCGAPISSDRESTGSGVQHLTTTQETSKKFKLQSIISVMLIVIGICWLITVGGADTAPEPGSLTVPGWMLTIGLLWYLVNRFRIWWHHK